MGTWTIGHDLACDDLDLVMWRWSARRPARIVLIDDEGRLTGRWTR